MIICHPVPTILRVLTIELILTSVEKRMAQAARFGRSESRIIGGENVTPVNKYPMVVALQNSTGALECSGTIYNKYVILTSAYCAKMADPNNQKYYVIAGIYDLNDPDSRYVQNMSIKTTKYHEKYQGETGIPEANNIGVIRLKRPLKFTDHVSPTNLPPANWAVPGDQKIEGIATGWGAGLEGGSSYLPSQPLQELRRFLVTRETCEKSWANTGKWPVTEDQVCMEKTGQEGTCLNDYGGPLYTYNDQYRTYVQVGITSVVPPFCPERYGLGGGFIFTKNSRYLTWIEGAVRNFSKRRTITKP